MPAAVLIRNATLLDIRDSVCIRFSDRISDIAPRLAPLPDETVLDAQGALLLPGLHDHHIHLLALAAALESLPCGPPDTVNETALSQRLRGANNAEPGRWLRGVGYHPVVAGDIDRYWLDRHVPDRPTRIQHRGGRLWILNSAALHALDIDRPSAGPAGLERIGATPTGRLYDEDRWLRQQLRQTPSDLSFISQHLVRYGITSFTDTGPANSGDEWQLFAAAQQRGELMQSVRMMGSENLTPQADHPRMQAGELKIHLLESRLPEHQSLVTRIDDAHRAGRAVAIHCVTVAELEYALSAWEMAGCITGDRIEHGSVIAPAQLETIARLGLRLVTQPHFIAERGDQYRTEVSATEQQWLYRCASLGDHGIPYAFGSDAPFGDPNPWAAMRAAVLRQTASGAKLGGEESIAPQQALEGFLHEADAPGVVLRRIKPDAMADLCLLDTDWTTAGDDLRHDHVRCVWINGALAYER